jgi:hypothetical protein
MMLRDDLTTNKVELFILFKNTDTERRKKQNFASSAVHEQFEKVGYLCTVGIDFYFSS